MVIRIAGRALSSEERTA